MRLSLNHFLDSRSLLKMDKYACIQKVRCLPKKSGYGSDFLWMCVCKYKYTGKKEEVLNCTVGSMPVWDISDFETHFWVGVFKFWNPLLRGGISRLCRDIHCMGAVWWNCLSPRQSAWGGHFMKATTIKVSLWGITLFVYRYIGPFLGDQFMKLTLQKSVIGGFYECSQKPGVSFKVRHFVKLPLK